MELMPGVLLTVALFVFGVVVFALRRSTAAAPRAAPERPLLLHAINDDRCTGCDACVTVCPTDVLGRSARGGDDVDVLIVGSGPGGLSCALSCMAHGLGYALIEKDELVASTIARYPKGKHVMAEPYDVRCLGLLPVWDAEKSEL